MSIDIKNKFQQKRKNIFKEVIRSAYNNNLKNDIDSIAFKLADSSDKKEITALKNEILISMGLSPSAHYDTELAAEVDTAVNLKEVREPLVTINKTICENCADESCKVECIDNPSQGLMIEDGRCISCGKCIPKCSMGAISDKVEFIPIVKYLKEDKPIYANVAPAIVGQFGADISMGQLRTALKSIGFTDMVEVALFADILTLREADEYNHMVKTIEDFLITSCCCPVWINLLTKHYPELNTKLTKTVSPMIASGRVIKAIFPDAVTVFIGPCVAKKAEAKLPELKGAIDYVLTFDEVEQVFEALDIELDQLEEDNKSQSSYGGRIYARTGGVSEAVKITVERINPDRKLPFKSIQANGVKECKELLDNLKEGNINANFIEGMGCVGGCVGGPKRIIEPEQGRQHVNGYGAQSQIKNPIDNLNINHILKYINGQEENSEKTIDQLSFDRLLLRNYPQK
ncbi:MAG: [Fe-Fe] hydrogenase large subunit C-terminal domain-containing protein [Halothermotrichaceae bacterium]